MTSYGGDLLSVDIWVWCCRSVWSSMRPCWLW